MANQPLPAEDVVFGEIIDDLNELVSDEDVDEFTKARKIHEIEGRALGLQSLNLALYYSALGSVAAARGDSFHSQQFHERSLQHGNFPGLFINYVVSLVNLNEFDNALVRAREFHARFPDDRETIQLLLDIAERLGSESLLLEFAEKYRKLAGEESPVYLNYLKEVEEGKELSRLCLAMSASAINPLSE